MPTDKTKRPRDSETTELPSTLLRSDEKAQEIWKKAHDSAVKTYGEDGSAHRVAYAALKHQYEKKGDRWVRKGWKGPSDPQATRGPTTRPKSTDEPHTPIAGGKVAKSETKACEKAKEARQENARARRRKAVHEVHA